MATIRSTPSRRARQPFSLTRTAYQVGKPWILEGKMFFGETGTPMRNNVFANMVFALAEPEPLTVANLTTKSLIPLIDPHVSGNGASPLAPTSRPMERGRTAAHREKFRCLVHRGRSGGGMLHLPGLPSAQ